MSKTHLFDLDGKIAFVSGASRGIGEAIAKLLAQQGAHVIVSSRKIDGCQAVAVMKEHGGGSIINVASINGVSPGEFQGIYSVTKAAVISMTKVFAKECAQFGIRCNALLPGLTDTKFASALVKNDAIRNLALQRIPLKRVAEPSEMAGAVLYLASEASSYTTGVALNVDGGFLS